MENSGATVTSSKPTAIKAVAERGSKVATDIISLEYQSSVGDFAFSVADRTAFTVTVLNQLGEYTSTNGVVKKSVISAAGHALIHIHAIECSKCFNQLQDAANLVKRAYRKGQRGQDGKTDQWTTQGLDWPFIKTQFFQSSEALESPMRKLLMILNVVNLAYSRMIAEKSWDERTSRYEQDLQRAIVALYANRKITVQDCKLPAKIVREPTQLYDIVEENGEDNPKAESSSAAASEKTRVEEVCPGEQDANAKTVIVDKENLGFGPKDDTEISIRSRRSRDTDSTVIDQRRHIYYRILHHLPFLSCFQRRDELIGEDEIGTLELYMQKPFLDYEISRLEVRWASSKQSIPQYEIERQLQHDRRNARVPLAEQLTRLIPAEDARIQSWLEDLPYKARILSLQRNTITLDVDGIKIKDVPTFRIIVSAQRVKHIKPFRATAGTPPPPDSPPPPSPSAGPPPKTRPTYLKVDKKFLEPTTLNVFELPWEWDFSTIGRDGSCQFMIIKTWLPEPDQDILFAHTRKLRKHGLVVDGSVGRAPPRELHVEREGKAAMTDADERILEKKTHGWKARGMGEVLPGGNVRGVQEEAELVDRLLREYTTWKGEGQWREGKADEKEEGQAGPGEGAKKVEDIEGKRVEEKVEEKAEERADEKAEGTAKGDDENNEPKDTSGETSEGTKAL